MSVFTMNDSKKINNDSKIEANVINYK